MKTTIVAAAFGLVLLTGSLGLPAAPLPPPDLLALEPADLDQAPVPVSDAAGPLPSYGLGAAGPVWNPSGAIHPGIQTYTAGSQCTANFVFYDAADIYIGQAAHCAGTEGPTATNGCTSGSLALGTPVDLGTAHQGTLVYSSWITMQAANTPANMPQCLGNDFALVKVAEADEGNVDPAVPFFGGPTGVGPTAGLGVGDVVYSFGNSGLRFGVEPVLSWKHGSVLFADGWQATVYTATPGIPGDSGSGFLDADGRAIGVLSTVAVLPYPLSNGVSGLQSALGYRAAAGGSPVTLATAPFSGGLV